MNEERKKELRHNIRRLTKLIGKAKKTNDFNEVENWRIQRGAFTKQLVDEFDEGFIIENGKTIFMPLEEVEEHYKNPDVRKSVALANAVNDVCQQRKHLKSRFAKLDSMAGDEVKVLMLEEITAHIKHFESMIDAMKKEIGETPIDWKKVDNKDDFLDGIDISSAM